MVPEVPELDALVPELEPVSADTAELLLVQGANLASGYRPLAVLSPPGASAIHSALVSVQVFAPQVKLCVNELAGCVESVILTVYWCRNAPHWR